MELRDLMQRKQLTGYRLSKETGIAQATISDICNKKTQLGKCSLDTVYRIAKALGVSVEDIMDLDEMNENVNRQDFEVYKSNVCHLLKSKGDLDFIKETLQTGKIRYYFRKEWYPECFYLLALTDYLSKEHEIPLCTDYEDLRQLKLKDTIYPKGILLLDEVTNSDKYEKKSIEEAIPEFLKYNIVECEVRNVV